MKSVLATLPLFTVGSVCNLGDVLPTNDDTNSDKLLYHPRFHIQPPTRNPRPDGSYAPEGMNDINSVFQAPNKLFHVMYQDHINCPDDINQANQTFGHVVSSDLITWTHLPPALIDVPSFDGTLGPWDGVGFNCYDTPTIIYNSHFQGPDFNSQTKTGARPTSPDWETTDPNLVNWTHFTLNPIDAFIGASTLNSPYLNDVDNNYYVSAIDSTTGICNLWRTTPSDTDCTNWEIIKQNYDFCSSASPEIYATNGPPNYTHVAKTLDPRWTGDGYVFGTLDPITNSFRPTTPDNVDYDERPRDLVMRPCDETDLNQIFTFNDDDGTLVNKGSNFCTVADSSNRAAVAQCTETHTKNVTYNPSTQQISLGSMCVDMDHGDISKTLNVYDCNVDGSPDIQNQQFSYIEDTNLFKHTLSGFCIAAMPIPRFPIDDLQFFEARKSNLFEDAGSLFTESMGTDDGRRIMIGWVMPGVSPAYDKPVSDDFPNLYHTTTTLREVKYVHEPTPSLVSYPIVEYEQLRVEDLGALPVNGRQLDIIAEFPLPLSDVVGLRVFESDDSNTYTLISVTPIDDNYFTLAIDTSNSGFAVPTKNNTYPIGSMDFATTGDEPTLSLRVMIDRSIVEAFAMGGRGVVTSTVYADAADGGASVIGEAVKANAWEMGCGWE